MRFILGFVTGAAVLLVVAYAHDAGILRFGPEAPFVNWSQVHELTGQLDRAITGAWNTHIKS